MMHIVLVRRLVRSGKGRGRHTVVGHITFNERGCDSKACEGCGDESELHVCCLGVVNRRCCSSDEEVSIVNGKAIILYHCVFWWAFTMLQSGLLRSHQVSRLVGMLHRP